MYAVKILLDSINPAGHRLTTFELTYPRFVHAELMTHRQFSRNAASSRAIPIAKMIDQVVTDPALPVAWGLNEKGMQASRVADAAQSAEAQALWLAARDQAVATVQALSALGIHKQLANRLLEPWMFITVIVSATEYANWFALRTHTAAQPEIKRVADLMLVAYEASTPTLLPENAWHTPLLQPDDWYALVRKHGADDAAFFQEACAISAGRCARVSYLTHDGVRDHAADVALATRLADAGHWSPFEHVAQAMADGTASGNFRGWRQYRKNFSHECIQASVGAPTVVAT